VSRAPALVAIAAGVAACCGTPREPAEPTPDPASTQEPAVTRSASPPRPPETACQRALVALADGRVAEWTGTDGCTRADVDHVFGASGEPDEPGQFGAAQRYPARPGAPRGLTVSYSRDEIIAVWIPLPAPAGGAELDAALGPPDAIRPPSRGGSATARGWAARGLVAYVDPDGTIVAFAGIRTQTPDALRAGRFLSFLDELVE
jgi:hypothetical protein